MLTNDDFLRQQFDREVRSLAPFTGDSMDLDTRWHMTQALGQFMSDVSEETYAAGWLIGLEDWLPKSLANHTEKEGSLPWAVSETLADTMRAMALTLGHWAKWVWYSKENGGGEQYVPYMPATTGDAQASA